MFSFDGDLMIDHFLMPNKSTLPYSRQGALLAEYLVVESVFLLMLYLAAIGYQAEPHQGGLSLAKMAMLFHGVGDM